MDATELCYTPATELRALLDSRAVSAVEVTEAVLARAASVGADLNVFAVSRAEQALAEARAADARLARGVPAGALDGIPLTVKDNLPSAGDRITNGSLAFADFVTPDDCALVARLRGAGGVLVGKTNLPEFAHRVLTDSPLHGVTRSPWNRAVTPGGSSGGASAAVAAGIAPLAVGTDGGGSIRCPAACTGIVGLKATLGRVPFEIMPDGFINFAFAGPMTRTVGDLALMYGVMAGPLAADPQSVGIPEPAVPDLADPPDLRGLRVGWCERFGSVGPDAETGRLTRAAVDALADAGAAVEAVDGALFADVFDYYVVFATTAHAGRLTALLEREGDRITPAMQASIRQGGGYSAVDLVQAGDRRTALYRGVERLFERYDVLVTPTMNALPKPLDAGGAINTAMYAEWAAYLYPFNLTGHPALSVPCGFSADGPHGSLPVGLQLVGRWYDEARLIGFARWFECHRPWADRRPLLT
jgi:aspartyl-tRNA(Asn)/glutamyl-tRNA(Gln) amidotransferase subunit A